MARGIDVREDGLVVPDSVAGSLDVLFDGQRVWSFNPARDGRPCNGHGRKVAWPKVLHHHLDGRAQVSLVDHVSREVLHTQEVCFRDSAEPLRIVDDDGNPLSVDKGGRLQRDFSSTEGSARAEIMDALERVIADLQQQCGLDVYLMYGCLLGAVRDGTMIGHDSDADVAYLSPFTHPFDIIRECSRACRIMRSLGWTVVRMSGANFKVWVPLPDGRRCGIDVFGSFHVGESFYVTGSLRGRLDRSALLPFGTVTLEGREIVAPHRPEEVLAFTYGPSWRVPDPAFHFDHDPADVRRMDAWFRAARRRHRMWQDFYKSPASAKVPEEPSRFAIWVQERFAASDATVNILDVGAGTGRDAAYFAARGHRVIAQDFTAVGLRQRQDQRRELGLTIHQRPLNLEDLRSVLTNGARFSHRPGVRQIYARGLLDALGDSGRANLWLYASMVQRRGGETFLEFRTPAARREQKFFGPHPRTFVDPDVAEREIEARGGTVVHREVGRGLAPLGFEDPKICRMVVRWTR
ncbi:MAG: class I SAM-dependent methyltransferase [Nocardioidaceae bacterium]|nr:class I SAM-dependent methyltransferase [Nocardioidaceae bacterium]